MKLGAATDDTPCAPRARCYGLADRAAFGLFFLMLMLAPVPDGSIAFYWLAIWCAVSATVVILASYRDVGTGVLAVMGSLLFVLAAYGLVVWLQSVSPGPAPIEIWTRAGQVLGIALAPLSGSVSGAPVAFFGRPLLAVLVLTGGMLLGGDDTRARALVLMIVCAAGLFGIFGLVSKFLTGPSSDEFYQDGALTAFFLSKNTTATYLGSAALAGLAMLVVKLARRVREGYSLFAGGRRSILSGASGLVTICTALLFLLLPLTQSRAGLAITVLLAAGTIAARVPPSRGGLLRAAIIGGLLLAVVLVFSGGAFHARQARLSLDADLRWEAYVLMVDAIAQRPLLGYGLGTFAETFPQFRDDTLLTPARFDIGHSTPLELAYEGGVPLALLVAGFVVVAATILVRGVIRRPFDPYILAALLVGLLGVLHSSVDFSLQMPGYLIICFGLVGVGLSRAFLPQEDNPPRRPRHTGPQTLPLVDSTEVAPPG